MYDDRVFTQHVYNHYDEKQVEADLEIGTTTRGPTWKLELKNITCSNWQEAMLLYESVRDVIAKETGEKAEEE